MRLIRWLVAGTGLGTRVWCGLCIVGTTLFGAPAFGQVTTLDPASDVGLFSASALGPDGLVLISYYDRANGNLKVAHCSNVACTSATLSTLDAAGDVGAGSSITIGGDGRGLLTYQASTTGSVKIAHCLDVSCTTAEIATIGAGTAGGVATGTDGLGLVSWLDSSAVVVVSHCDDPACSARTSTSYGPPAVGGNPSPRIGVGSDGLGLVLYQTDPTVTALHCLNTNCTAATTSVPIQVMPPGWLMLEHTLAFGSDGRALFPVERYDPQVGEIIFEQIAHCTDPDCSQVDLTTVVQVETADGAMAIGPDGFGIWATQLSYGPLVVFHCQDPACASVSESEPFDMGFTPGLAVGQDGFPLISYYGGFENLIVLHCLSPYCGAEPKVAVGDATVVEGDSGTVGAVFTVSLSVASSLPISVDYATADGTATAPADYAAASGTVSFAPGVTAQTITVGVAGDTLYEGAETFSVVLSNASNALLDDAQGIGTISDDEVGQLTTLDEIGNVGDYSDVAIGADGLGLISYYDRTNGDLKVAHCSDAACSSATLSRLDTVGDVGAWTSIVIGGDGLGLVTYQDVTASLVKAAHCLDLLCTAAEISTLGAGGPGGVATGADGLGLVSWLDSNGVVEVTHCDGAACSTRTSTPHGPPVVGGGFLPKIALGPDGLGLVVYQSHSGMDYSAIRVLHCLNVACTSVTTSTPVAVASLPPFYEWVSWHHNLAIGADGLAFFTYHESQIFPIPDAEQVSGFPENEIIAHCTDAACSSVQSTLVASSSIFADGAVAAGSDGLGLWATSASGGLVVFHCGDSSCGGLTASPPLDSAPGSALGLTVGTDGLPLISYYAGSADLRAFHCLTSTCGPVVLSIGDATLVEGDSGTAGAVFTVTLSGAVGAPVSFDFATADGTATAPADYVPASGTLSFAPGTTATTITVLLAGDTIDELDETFTVNLSNAANASIADGQGIGTILDDDSAPRISIGDAAVLEGDSGTVDASLTVSLSNPSSFTVGADWGTDTGGGATATPGVDFVVDGGSLTFAPGELTRVVTAHVLGDSVIEPDEFFFVRLTNPTNATLDDDLGRVTISDDDAPSLSFDELVHGSSQRHDLAAQPGPVADRDYFRLGQRPRSSWEVVVDGASGDVVPLILERLAADNVTVLQAGTSVSGGSSVSMRWPDDTGFPVTNQHLSVRSGGCGATCDASAVYRIRAYETTGGMARFNNSATQVTVVLLENTGPSPVQGTLWFWGPGGTLLTSGAFSIAPQASYVLNTATVAALVGASGSITVTDDARYGDLRGKAVAVEPATGFSFDTAMTFRPR